MTGNSLGNTDFLMLRWGSAPVLGQYMEAFVQIFKRLPFLQDATAICWKTVLFLSVKICDAGDEVPVKLHGSRFARPLKVGVGGRLVALRDPLCRRIFTFRAVSPGVPYKVIHGKVPLPKMKCEKSLTR